MSGHDSTRKPLSQEWKNGFLAAHEGLRNAKERSDEDLTIYALSEAHESLQECTGYVRMGFGQDGLYWVRWKWTAGGLEGRYTFGSGVSLAGALANCMGAKAEVEAGKRKAHLDTGYRKGAQK